MSAMGQDSLFRVDSVDHDEQTDGLADLGVSASRALSGVVLPAIDFSDIIPPVDHHISDDFKKLIDSSRIWAESAGVITSYFNSVMSKIPIDGLAQAVSTIYDRSLILEQISGIAAEFSDGVARAIGQKIKAQEMASSLLESLRPSIEGVGRILDNLDVEGFWGSCRDSAEKWGGHGWVLLDGMPMHMIGNCPDTFPEANRVLKPLALASLPETKETILANSRKRKDAVEMLSLYDAGHYKSCAMMACSLIEGEIINWKIVKTRTRKVNSKPSSLSVADDVGSSQRVMVDLINVIAAYDHFFRSVFPFNRELEGELNRNFLMHGMMYKEVTQVACLKLFVLLERVAALLPSCSTEG